MDIGNKYIIVLFITKLSVWFLLYGRKLSSGIIHMTFICKICEKECKNIKALAGHVYGAHGLRKEEYYLKFNTPPICSRCGTTSLAFINIVDGYKQYCSKCAITLGAIKQWENADERRKKLSELTRKNNLLNSRGRSKGSKNKKQYPSVKKNFSPEYLKIISKRFTDMNNNRTPEEYHRILKKAISAKACPIQKDNEFIRKTSWSAIANSLNMHDDEYDEIWNDIYAKYGEVIYA
jgi:hypothetical protein